MPLPRIFAIPLVLLVSQSAAAQSLCPATLEVRTTIEIPPGWEATSADVYKARLIGASVFSSHPREMVALRPRELKGKDGLAIAEWGVDEHSWIECIYDHTHSTVARQVPKGLNRCRSYSRPAKWGADTFLRLECE